MRIGIDAREIQGNRTGVGRYLLEVLKSWPQNFFSENDILLYFKNEVPDLKFLGSKKYTAKTVSAFGGKDLFWESALGSAIQKDKLQVFWIPNGACGHWRGDCVKIATFHDLSFFKEKSWFSLKERWMRQWKARKAAQNCRFFIADSETTKKDMRQHLKIREDRISVISLGCDHVAEKSSTPERNAHKILFVGSFLNRRPVEALIEAMAILKQKGLKAHLQLIGENRTSPRKDFETLIKKLEVSEAVSMTGYITEPELQKKYEGADIFCFPSYYEGFGLTLLEAQRHGLPVLTFKNSSIAEICASSVLYADNATPQELAQRLETLLKDVELRKDLIQKGYKNAARYPWNQTGNSIAQILQESLN